MLSRRMALSALCAMVLGSTLASASPHFKSPSMALLLPSAAPASTKVARQAGLGDIDGDGRIDVVAGAANGLYVFHQALDGSFGPPDAYLPGTDSEVEAVLDLDGNPGDDVIVLQFASIAPSHLVTLTNAGGTLVQAGSASLPDGSPPVRISDFNEDGRPDAVVGILDSNQVYVLLNNGTGAFLPPLVLATGMTGGRLASAGDYNGDGHADIMILGGGTAEDSAAVLLGDGHGAFGSPVLSEISGTSATAGAFDHVPGADIVAYGNSTSYEYHSGNGTGTFGVAQPLTTVPGPAFAAAPGHFNSDSELDCVVNSYDPFPSIRVMLGHGDGSFTAAADAAAGLGPVGFDVKDVDGNGFDDVVTASQYYFFAQLFLSNGDGTFGSPQLRSDPGYSGLALADMDGDGRLDAVQPNRLDGRVTIFKGVGDGSFVAASTTAGTGTPFSAKAALLDGDARPDLLVPAGSTLEVFLNDGAGHLLAPSSIPVSGSPRFLATGDLSLDGNVDVTLPGRTNGVVTVLLGNGAGGFAAAPAVTLASGSAISTAIGKFGADAIPDLAVASATQIVVYTGLGNGSFAGVAATVPSSSGVQRLVAADVDGDGRTDLLASTSTTKVAYWRNDGAGGFEPRVDIDTQPYASIGVFFPAAVEPAVHDFDGDGANDLLVITSNGYASLIPGTAPGVFGTPIPLGTGAPGSSIALGDLDGDGDMDVVTSYGGSSRVSTLSSILNQRYLVGVPPTLPPRGSGVAIASAWPNPVRGEFTLQYSVPNPGPVAVDLIAIDGRIVRHVEQVTPAGGLQTMRLGIAAGLAPGVYEVMIRHAAGRAVRKLVVLR